MTDGTNPLTFKLPTRKNPRFKGWLKHWFDPQPPEQPQESISRLMQQNREDINQLRQEADRAVPKSRS